MLVLVIGLVVLLGMHSLTAVRGLRANLAARLGEGGYKALHSLVSAIGLGLIVWGFSRYRAAGLIQIWTPPEWTRHLTITLMWFAFIALACVNPAPGRIRGWLRHPLLVAVKIWAFAHLLANGDAGGILLFGSFLAWAVFTRISLKKRGDLGAPRLASFTSADAVALGLGTLGYIAMIALHPILIGVSVIDF